MAVAFARSQQHTHHTEPAHHMTRRRLGLAVGLTLLILAVEIAGGLFSHSLALLSDAGHVFTDVMALALAWYATRQVERPSNGRKTFGYHRVEILAALANAATLILIVGGIVFEAIMRLRQPVAVTPWVMFAAAGVGIVVNLIIAGGLHGVHGQNLNVRAALLHVLGDVGASVGVVVAGVVILLTGWYLADPLLSLAIALLIARGAWRVLRETLDILMEAAPTSLNVPALVRDLSHQPGITDIHDVHVWTITGGVYALSAHVRVGDRPLSDCDSVLDRLNGILREHYHITHSTLQLECAGCASPELYCTLSPDGGAAQQHAHAPHNQHGQVHTHPTDELHTHD